MIHIFITILFTHNVLAYGKYIYHSFSLLILGGSFTAHSVQWSYFRGSVMWSLSVQKLSNVETIFMTFAPHVNRCSCSLQRSCFFCEESCEYYLNESMAWHPGVLITWHLHIQKQQFISLITSDVWTIQGLNWLFAVLINSCVLGIFPIFITAFTAQLSDIMLMQSHVSLVWLAVLMVSICEI